MGAQQAVCSRCGAPWVFELGRRPALRLIQGGSAPEIEVERVYTAERLARLVEEARA
jgi:hypothetical protein